MTALNFAASGGHAACLDRLIALGARPDRGMAASGPATQASSEATLPFAITAASPDCVLSLMIAGADPDLHGSSGSASRLAERPDCPASVKYALLGWRELFAVQEETAILAEIASESNAREESPAPRLGPRL